MISDVEIKKKSQKSLSYKGEPRLESYMPIRQLQYFESQEKDSVQIGLFLA